MKQVYKINLIKRYSFEFIIFYLKTFYQRLFSIIMEKFHIFEIFYTRRLVKNPYLWKIAEEKQKAEVQYFPYF